MKLLTSRTRPFAGGHDDLLAHLGPGGFTWLRNGSGFVTAGVAARIPVGPGSGRFERASLELGRFFGTIDVDDPLGLPGTGPLAVGALPFADSSPGELVVPALVVGRDAGGMVWRTETTPVAAPPTPAAPSGVNGLAFTAKEHPDKEEWTANVRQVLGAIGAGHVRKVVLARELVLEADKPFDRRALLERLSRRNPTCFTYAAGGFVGASTELLVRRRGGEVESCPMAGTVARGSTPSEDEALVDALSHSRKDAEEHALLVDAVVHALAPLCAEGPEAAPAGVVRLPTVSHLATLVRGRLATPAPSALSLAGRLHPTPAVGGLPRPAALAAIATLEGFERGLYAGPVGWVDARGDGEWAVALRGAELDGSRARLVAGAGIVAGSDPDAEWAETEAKLQAMLSAVRA